MANKTMTVLLADDDLRERARFEAYAAGQSDIELLDCVETAPDAMNGVRTLRPQVLVLDLELKGSHGMDCLKALRALDETLRPAVVVLTAITGEATHRAVQSMGVERVFSKGDDGYRTFGPAYVFDYLREIRPYFHVGQELPMAESDASRLGRIEEYLAQCGAPLGTKSLSYMVAGVLAVAKQPHGHVNLKRQFDPVLCEKFDVSYDTLIAGMQYCMECMWDHPRERSLAAEYAPGTTPCKGVGELKQVLVFLADKFR